MKNWIVCFFAVVFLAGCTKNINEFEEPCWDCDGGGGGNPPYNPPPPPDPNIQFLSYRGIRPDDPGGQSPIDNPERGFRFIFAMHASNLREPWHNIDYQTNFSANLQAEEHELGGEKVKLAQIYFYIADYLGTDISPSALANMQTIFDHLKASGIKAILRFAYRKDDNSRMESLGDIDNHLNQLRAFIHHNDASIFLMQVGFVGLWGEWHHSGLDNRPNEKKIVIRKILEVIPASKRTQVRETADKNATLGAFSGHVTYDNGYSYRYISYPALSQTQAGRIGFHNDYFVLDEGPGAHWDYRWPDQDFHQVHSEGRYTVVDGEMPIHTDLTTVVRGSQGGWYAARRMRAHGYSSFNLRANYIINLAAWKTHWLTPSQFRSDGTLVTDDYFINQNGSEVPRRAFDYIRDHLGYRLQLREGRIPRRTALYSNARMEFTIKNFGFSRMINHRPIYVVLIDQAGNVTAHRSNTNAEDIQSTYGQNDGIYTITADISTGITVPTGIYQVGIWMPDHSELMYNPAYAVKLANGNIQWWTSPDQRYLVNIVGTTEVF